MYVGLACGATFALSLPTFLLVWQYVLCFLTVAGCVAAPYAGILLTRAAHKWLARKRQKTRRRGPEYADYAYILY